MDLRLYLKTERISHRLFAERLGVNQSTITRLCAPDPPWPSRDLVQAIDRATGGRVRAADFYKQVLQVPANGDELKEAIRTVRDAAAMLNFKLTPRARGRARSAKKRGRS
jgi:DNA-binding transcriptional regulator YdaS (Cro superfamily)